MIGYRKASRSDLTQLWAIYISQHSEDARWKQRAEECLAYNRSGQAATFVVLHNRAPVGGATLFFSPACHPIDGRTVLADGASVANLRDLHIREEFRNPDCLADLIRIMEQFAQRNGCRTITLGVPASRPQELVTYIHLGYTRFVCTQTEDGVQTLYYAKDLDRTYN